MYRATAFSMQKMKFNYTDNGIIGKNALFDGNKRIQVKFNELITFLSTLRHSMAFLSVTDCLFPGDVSERVCNICRFRCAKWKMKVEWRTLSLYNCRFSMWKMRFQALFQCIVCNIAKCNWMMNTLSKLHGILIKRPTTIRRHFSSSEYSRLSRIYQGFFCCSFRCCHQFQIQKLQVVVTRSFIFLWESIFYGCVCERECVFMLLDFVLYSVVRSNSARISSMSFILLSKWNNGTTISMRHIINYSIDERAKAFRCRCFLDSENGK